LEETMREWLYGRNPVYETLVAGRRQVFQLIVAEGVQEKDRLKDILRIADKKKIQLRRLARQQIDRLTDQALNHQGVLLETSGYPYSHLQDMLALAYRSQEEPFFILLDSLQDPQNLGSLFRTAEAVGVHGVMLPLKRTASVTPAVVSASSGASEHLLIVQVNLAQAISWLKENQVWIAGLDNSPTASLPDEMRLDGALGLVVGGEGSGIRPLVRDSCDYLIRLPMRGRIESLNAATAGSIALYLAWQARNYR